MSQNCGSCKYWERRDVRFHLDGNCRYPVRLPIWVLQGKNGYFAGADDGQGCATYEPVDGVKE